MADTPRLEEALRSQGVDPRLHTAATTREDIKGLLMRVLAIRGWRIGPWLPENRMYTATYGLNGHVARIFVTPDSGYIEIEGAFSRREIGQTIYSSKATCDGIQSAFEHLELERTVLERKVEGAYANSDARDIA